VVNSSPYDTGMSATIDGIFGRTSVSLDNQETATVHTLTIDERIQYMGIDPCGSHREHALEALSIIEGALESGADHISVKRALMREHHEDVTDDPKKILLGRLFSAAWNHQERRFV
jgi:hypothetical protein